MDLAAAQQELAQLNADIVACEKVIARWEAKGGLDADEPNARYAFDFEFGTVPDYSNFPLARAIVQVKKNTVFQVKSFEQAYTVIGTFTDGDSSQDAVITLPQSIKLGLFAGKYRIRDNGSDAPWQDQWLPLTALLTGNVNGLQLREGRRSVSPGAEITVEVQARFFSNFSGLTGLSAISGHKLQISLVGYEEPFAG